MLSMEMTSHYLAHKTNSSGSKLSAAAIARFWETSVRISAGSEHMMKERTIDTCITLKERLFDIPDVDAIVQRSENEKADSSAWNSLWKLQEMIYRCQSNRKIAWCFSAIDDMIVGGKVSDRDISVNSLKTGPRSLTVVAMTCFSLKSFLLG